MFQRVIVNLVISFVLRQIAKFRTEFDWAKARADVITRVKDLLPGTWLDAEGEAVVNALFDGLQLVLGASDEIEKILRLLADSKWEEALDYVKQLLLGAWDPSWTEGHAAAKQLVADTVLLERHVKALPPVAGNAADVAAKHLAAKAATAPVGESGGAVADVKTV